MKAKDVIREVVANDLMGYSEQLKDAFDEGYVLSNSSEFFPRMIGYMFCATLVKEEMPVEASVSPSDQRSSSTEGVGSQSAPETIVEGMRSVPDKVEPSKRKYTKGSK